MTTTPEREALIEKAQEAAIGYQSAGTDVAKYHAMKKASEMLVELVAVFEEQQKPSVIERHDLVMPIYDEEPQGEPSDAQVLAALNAYDPRTPTGDLNDYGPEHVEDMRAALRAASAVTEQGENR